jgi:hypothetical protein
MSDEIEQLKVLVENALDQHRVDKRDLCDRYRECPALFSHLVRDIYWTIATCVGMMLQ